MDDVTYFQGGRGGGGGGLTSDFKWGSEDTLLLGRVLLGLFRNRNTRNRRYLCSFGSYSVFGMNGISFPRSFCSP